MTFVPYLLEYKDCLGGIICYNKLYKESNHIYFMADLKPIKKSYSERKDIIKNRLKHFKNVWNEDDKRIFAELCFCLLTPQSKAKICDKAIETLVKTKLLFNGTEKNIKDHLIGVRFNNNKARYIIQAREMFGNSSSIKIKNKIKEFKDNLELREWLVNNVKGVGYKESGHFLRNIGMYENITILDRHILKNLHKYNIIGEIPKSLSKNKYFEIEEKMKKFADEIKIPVEELDLLFWSEETGEVFK